MEQDRGQKEAGSGTVWSSVFGRAQLHDPYVSRKDMFLLESDLLDRGEEGKGKERENCFKELGNLWPQITATKKFSFGKLAIF